LWGHIFFREIEGGETSIEYLHFQNVFSTKILFVSYGEIIRKSRFESNLNKIYLPRFLNFEFLNVVEFFFNVVEDIAFLKEF